LKLWILIPIFDAKKAEAAEVQQRIGIFHQPSNGIQEIPTLMVGAW
jgi:hypothetical protein